MTNAPAWQGARDARRDLRQGVRDALFELGRLWPVLAAGASLLVLFMAGVLEGQAAGDGVSARDAQLRLLQGVAFGLVLPLFAFAATRRVGGSRSQLMLMGWSRYGGNRQGYALGRQLLVVVLTGLVIGVAGLLALGLGAATSAPGTELPLSGTNLLAVVWVGALGAVSYVGGLSLAHQYGGNVGRVLFLIGDWSFGSGTSLLALPWPRAHLRTLLGGSAPLGVSARDAALYLLAFTVLSFALYLRRIPR
jgi:hypothetical protein